MPRLTEHLGGMPTELAWKIFTDRYTIKDQSRAFVVGDLAVVQTNDDPKWPKKELAEVVAIDGERMTLKLLTGAEKGVTVQRLPRECDRPVEVSLNEVATRIGKGLAAVEPTKAKQAQWAEAFREEIAALRIVPGGRVWAGAGTGIPLTLFNCYVIPNPKDSRQGIVETLGQMIEIMSRGGGVGINVSSLRPFRAPVRSVNGRSSGAVSWMELYSLATGLVEQGGSRRGALMLQLDIRHPDWKRFIDVKKTPGKVENANISFRITDDFMQAVKENGQWTFWFPDTNCPEYDAEWNGDFDAWQAKGLPIVTYDTVPAREVWKEIIRAAWECAEPGVVFSTRHEKESNSWYFNPLVCTNPCVTGDTLVSTAQGLSRAKDLFLAQQAVPVVVDGRFGVENTTCAASPVFFTGIKPVYRLLTKEGFEVRLTADHRVMTERGWVQAADLVPGDQIHVLNQQGGFGTSGSYELGLALGWLVGDGTIHAERAVLSFHGAEKTEVAPVLAGAVNSVARHSQDGRDHVVTVVEAASGQETRVQSTRLGELARAHGLADDQLQVPEAVLVGSRAMQVGFLRGLFSADARVEATRSRHAVVLPSSSVRMLKDVQRVLLNLGLYSRLTVGRRAEEAAVLRISGQSLLGFAREIGFLQTSKQAQLQQTIAAYARGPYRERFLATFTALVADGEEPVFDLTVPDVQAFTANGLVVHNCAEQPLPAWGVCTLGHLNLARFYDENKHDVAWEQLARSMRVLVRLLDDVVDATHYFIQENRDNQMRERRIGAGSLGLGELLIRLGLRYGSPEAVVFTEKLYKFIAIEGYLASVEIAKEKGPFPAFDAEKYLQSGFIQKLPDDVRQQIRQHGIRNVTVLTQAPTGTVGTMLDTSTGIEPFYSLKFVRQSRLGKDMQYVGIAKEWVEKHPGQELPDYFVGAMDLTPEEHIAMQAAVQRWTDSSISKTANAPSDYTEEQTADLYMLAYDMGCKGVTIYRDQSRSEQVLHNADDRPAPAASEAAAATAPVAPPASDLVGVGGNRVNGTWGHIRPIPRPRRLTGYTDARETPLGKLFLTLNTLGGHPVELFAQIGRAGSDVSAFTEAVARLVSLALRSGVDPQEVADQLLGIGGSRSVGFGPNRVRSVPDAIGQFVSEVLREVEDDLPSDGTEPEELPQETLFALGSEARGDANLVSGNGHGKAKATVVTADICPGCGEHSLVHEEGCVHCVACGHSEC